MVPFLEVLDGMVKRGVEVRLIHAKDPGPNWRDDFDRYPDLWTGMERMLCPRVHFKCIIVDGVKAYFGSANLTGAGMGAKSERKRNFESGVLTDDPALVAPLVSAAIRSCRYRRMATFSTSADGEIMIEYSVYEYIIP